MRCMIKEERSDKSGTRKNGEQKTRRRVQGREEGKGGFGGGGAVRMIYNLLFVVSDRGVYETERHAFRAVLEMMESKQHDEDCKVETIGKAAAEVLDRVGWTKKRLGRYWILDTADGLK